MIRDEDVGGGNVLSEKERPTVHAIPHQDVVYVDSQLNLHMGVACASFVWGFCTLSNNHNGNLDTRFASFQCKLPSI